jgi:hypothetical protein
MDQGKTGEVIISSPYYLDLQTFRPSDLQTFRPSDLLTFRLYGPSDSDTHLLHQQRGIET